MQGGASFNSERSDMLNLYAVTVWHLTATRYVETIEVRTYSVRRAEQLARETFPGCRALAEVIRDVIDPPVASPYLRPAARAH